jgi:predicted RNA-binding Zn-ribbon protein involved in translation (DUF1610 family)
MVSPLKPQFQLKTEGRVRLLGGLQLAASGVIFFLLLIAAIQGQLNILTIILGAFAIGLNFFAGYLSIKMKALGYWLSIVNQSLQTVSFATGSIFYRYSGIGGVYVFLKTGETAEFGFNASYEPGFNIIWGVNVQETYLAIDILAVFFIGVLLSALDFVKRETSNAMAYEFRCKECDSLIVEKSPKWDKRQVCPYCGARDDQSKEQKNILQCDNCRFTCTLEDFTSNQLFCPDCGSRLNMENI